MFVKEGGLEGIEMTAGEPALPPARATIETLGKQVVIDLELFGRERGVKALPPEEMSLHKLNEKLMQKEEKQ